MMDEMKPWMFSVTHLVKMKKAQTNPDICVLVNLGQVQHVVHSQHTRRRLGEVHGRVDVVLHLKHQGCDTKTWGGFINAAV